MHRRGFFGALLGLVGVAAVNPVAKPAIKVQPWVDGLWYFAKSAPRVGKPVVLMPGMRYAAHPVVRLTHA